MPVQRASSAFPCSDHNHERLAINWLDGKQVPDSLEEIEAFTDPGIDEEGESDLSSDENDDDVNTNESD